MRRMPSAEQLRIVVPRFGPEVVGGSGGLARRLAAALTARGWEIEVCATTAVAESTWAGSLPPSERDPLGFSVRRFPVTRRRRPRAFALGSRAFFRLPPALRPERAWLRAQGPFAPALLAALRTARPAPTLFTPYLYYPTVFGLPVARHPRLLMPAAHPERPLRLRAVGSAISAADAIWYHTPEERELVESVHPASSQIPAAIGTVGVEPIAGDPSRFAASTGIQGPLLLYGGRLTPGKGGEVLLEGFRRLRAAHPEVTLVLAGSAPDGESPAGVVATGRLDETAW